MFTVKQLIDKAFNDHLGDDKRQIWSTELMLEYFNDGWIEIAQKSKWYAKEQSYDLFPNSQITESLPQDMIEIEFFSELDVANQTSTRMEVERLTPENAVSKDIILLTGLKGFLYHTNTRTTALLSYFAIPDPLLITDTATLNDSILLGLVEYMCFRAYKKDQSTESLERAQMHFMEYQRKANIISDIAFKSLQVEPLVTKYQGF